MFDFLQVIMDDRADCSYIDGQVSRLPMSLPVREVTPVRFDALMEAGYRRTGAFFYNTQCPNCVACEPIRLDVAQFQLSRTHKRTLKRSAELDIAWCLPVADAEHVALFNKHRRERNLSRVDREVDEDDYRCFLMNSPNPSLELSIRCSGKLISASITDVGHECISAVYCLFDPDYSQFGLGTLSILKQIEFATQRKLRWLYLGLYVAANKHLSYKANYRPHQRRIDGQWQEFA